MEKVCMWRPETCCFQPPWYYSKGWKEIEYRPNGIGFLMRPDGIFLDYVLFVPDSHAKKIHPQMVNSYISPGFCCEPAIATLAMVKVERQTVQDVHFMTDEMLWLRRLYRLYQTHETHDLRMLFEKAEYLMQSDAALFLARN